MLDTLSGIESVIARGSLPPRIKAVVRELSKDRPLWELHGASEKELRYLLALVEGPGILAAIVGRLLEKVPVDEIDDDSFDVPVRSDREKWDEAKATEVDKLVLLLSGDHYIAYDQDAQVIGAALNTHLFNEGRDEKLGLSIGQQADWQSTLEENQIDVVLLEEDPDADTGYQRIAILQSETA